MPGVVTACNQHYSLNYTASDNGSIVGTTPQTVDHGADGTLVTATPDAGYHFVSWSDGVLNASRTDTNVTSSISVTATFAINSYSLTYTAGAHGTSSGTTPQTVNHGADGTAVTAVADIGYHFVKWSDDIATASRTDLNVTEDVSVTATFVINSYTLDVTVVGNGAVSKNPDSVTYLSGSKVELTATPALGWSFSGLSVDASGSTNLLNVTMNGNKSITATFTQNTYTLTVFKVGNGTITRNNNGPYHLNGVVILAAVADAG